MPDEIDSLCEDFERRWNVGERPMIAPYLSQCDTAVRSELLCELLQIEFWWRRRESPRPNEEEYHAQFPRDRAIVSEAFEAFHQRSLAEVEGLESDPEVTQLYTSEVRDAGETKLSPLLAKAERGDHVRYFGEYELLEEIARGGMGVVFRATQLKLNRIVALKMILSGELSGEDEIRRFRVEAEAAARLDHPGIVPIYEIGEHHGQHYFSMGFVEGQSLASRVKDGPLPPREAAEIVRKIAEAIHYAHQKGVIHRDLKPANVLLDLNGQPKVTDFGLAKQVESDHDLTRTGAILGTPGYMSPEQASGHAADVGFGTDVYSLGAILYCLLTGRPPFQSSSVVETLRRVIATDPLPPRLLNPEIHEDLEVICLRCLEKDPASRLPDAGYLSEELVRYLSGRPILSRKSGRWELIRKWCARNRAETVLLVTLGVLLLVGGSLAALLGWKVLEEGLGADGLRWTLLLSCALGPACSVSRLTGLGRMQFAAVAAIRVWKNCVATIASALYAFASVALLLSVFGPLYLLMTNHETFILLFVLFLAVLPACLRQWRVVKIQVALVIVGIVCVLSHVSASSVQDNSVLAEIAVLSFLAALMLSEMLFLDLALRFVHRMTHRHASIVRRTINWVPWPLSLAELPYRPTRVLVMTNLFPLVIAIGVAHLLLSLCVIVAAFPIWTAEQFCQIVFPRSPAVLEFFGYMISVAGLASLLTGLTL